MTQDPTTAFSDGSSAPGRRHTSKSLLGLTIGHYRVVDNLGGGGMGEVYVGYDETLERKVALKTLRGEFVGHPEMKARFLQEARILSKLDHPHICQIYDYLEHASGDLLVLELLKGSSLAQVLEQKPLPSRAKRLEMAIAIADAVATAHAAGVIHRDLKPANVMLLESGVIRVLDFGLARSVSMEPSTLVHGFLDDDDGVAASTSPASQSTCAQSGLVHTKAGVLMGTLSYMSPEQARMEPVTPASDMYSFGLLLQELLTGQRIHQPGTERSEILAKTRRAETPPVQGVPRDLKTLIEQLKAVDPRSRPSSVETVHRLRRIHGKPRRRLFQVGAALLALAGVGGTIKYTVDIRAREQEARAAEVAADHARGQAENLINFLLEDLYKGLEPLGKLELLDDVAARSLEYFEGLPPARRAEARDRVAVALRYVGNVRRAQGKHSIALLLYRQATSIEKELVLEEPDNARWQAQLAWTHIRVGEALWSSNDLDGGVVAAREAIDIVSRLAEDRPADLQWRVQLGWAYSVLGGILTSQGDLDAAARAHRQALDAARELLKQDPENPEWLDYSARSHGQIAEVQSLNGDLHGAFMSRRQVVEIYERLVGKDPTNATWRVFLAINLSEIGTWLRAQGDLTGALPSLRRSRTIYQELVRDDPTNMETLTLLAFVHSTIGHVQRAQGDESAARASFNAATETVAPFITPAQRDLTTLHAYVEALLSLGRIEKARPWAEILIEKGYHLHDPELVEVLQQSDLLPEDADALGTISF